MEVTGTIKAIFDTQRVSDKFQKREFVLTTEASTPYPQQVQFQVTQDKCNELNKYAEGQEVKIQFNLRGREWQGKDGVKYFNTLDCWRIELARVADEHNHAEKSAEAKPVFQAGNPNDSDLPF
jgi:hypothetical protein